MCPDIWTVITIIIAGLALFVAIWQVLSSREHNRLSVRPLLAFYRNIDIIQQEACLSVKNVGVGPAIIKEFSIHLDDQPISPMKYENIITAFQKLGITHTKLQVTVLAIDQALSIEEKHEIIYFKPAKYHKLIEIHNALHRINIVIKYESVYRKSYDCELNSDLSDLKFS